MDCEDSQSPACPPSDPLGALSALRCSAPAAGQPPWHVLLCLSADRSPFLGQFHAAPAPADMELYRRSKPHWPETSGGGGGDEGDGYRSGSPLLTPSGRPLRLPRTLLDGRCAPAVPVPFLRPTTARCPVTDVRSSCRERSPLDPSGYDQLSVLAGQSGAVVTARVQRLCGSAADGPVTQCPSRPIALDGDVCRNALVNLVQVFSWNGSEVVDATVNVTVADLAVPNGRVNVTQTVAVSFRHVAAGNSTAPSPEGSAARRLGKTGYRRDDVIISSAEPVNVTSADLPADQLGPLLTLQSGLVRGMAVKVAVWMATDWIWAGGS
ncbi:Tectonic-2 [Amphibalanus amphitrite]|uniref:Tectonic-2 n=1 Tax=Amphibalanus amphitrite TaxID=1232801 RepID=A0A6A4VBP1_AMPAM|nr:Tectonic-2 [Amphibalanus amphitrite]